MLTIFSVDRGHTGGSTPALVTPTVTEAGETEGPPGGMAVASSNQQTPSGECCVIRVSLCLFTSATAVVYHVKIHQKHLPAATRSPFGASG